MGSVVYGHLSANRRPRRDFSPTTRWASALPIRRAMALAQFGEAGLQDERAVDLLSRSEPEYVLEVAGFPTTLIHQGAKKSPRPNC